MKCRGLRDRLSLFVRRSRYDELKRYADRLYAALRAKQDGYTTGNEAVAKERYIRNAMELYEQWCERAAVNDIERNPPVSTEQNEITATPDRRKRIAGHVCGH